MRKKTIAEEVATRAARREVKKRPRMKMHGASLRKANPHAGSAVIKYGK